MRLQVLQCPQGVLRGVAKVLRKRLAVACQGKSREDDQAVQRAPERLRRHDKADREDPQGDPVVAPPEPHLDDRVARVLVDGGVVHDYKNVTTITRGVQCALLVEELLHELGPREPVKEEPLVPVLPDDRDVVGLGPPAAADDEVGPVRLRKPRCLPKKVAAHVALPSLSGPGDHHHHGPALEQGCQVASPSREHLYDDSVYISLP